MIVQVPVTLVIIVVILVPVLVSTSIVQMVAVDSRVSIRVPMDVHRHVETMVVG